MDINKLNALLALRKQSQDDPNNAYWGDKPIYDATNLTSPEEYKQMPTELKDVIKTDTIRSADIPHPTIRMNYSNNEDRDQARQQLKGMGQELADQDVDDYWQSHNDSWSRFQQLKKLLGQ